MKNRMNQDILNKIRALQSKGYNYIQIAYELNITVHTSCNWCVGLYKNKESVYDDPCKWTPAQEMKLRHRFALLPKRNYAYTRQFMELCEELGKSQTAVCCKIYAMNLKEVSNARYEPDPPKEKIKRPPPVYTNIPTPFQIADDLHRGNRIY